MISLKPTEKTPFLDDKFREAAEWSFWHTKKVLVGLFVLVGTAVFSYSSSPYFTKWFMNLAFNPKAIVVRQHGKSVGWYFYKTAFTLSKHSEAEAVSFMTEHTGGFDCSTSNLGCNGKKFSCSYGLDDAITEIHFVEAPDLFSHAKDNDDLGQVGWEKIHQNSFGSMERFTPFMHNKVQIFTTELDKVVSKLEVDGYAVMKRLSPYEDGWAAHASVGIAGKIWEFVGYPPDDYSDYTLWTEEECPFAHRVDANMSMMYEYATNSMLVSPRTFWISTHVATSSLSTDGFNSLFDMLENETGAQIVQHTDHPFCKVVTVSYVNQQALDNGGAYGADITLRFIHNRKQQTLTDAGGNDWFSVSDYEEYITRVHERYLRDLEHPEYKATKRWRNWDHWLDQHVGIAWTKTKGCSDKNKQISEALLKHDLYTGERDADGDHFYTAYSEVAMTIEYDTASCTHGIGVPDICTCSRYNSDLLSTSEQCKI